MTLAYTADSAHADEVTAEKLDRHHHPAGRAGRLRRPAPRRQRLPRLMMVKLAERVYGRQGCSNDVFGGSSACPSVRLWPKASPP
jgi:hypothetical protein